MQEQVMMRCQYSRFSKKYPTCLKKEERSLQMKGRKITCIRCKMHRLRVYAQKKYRETEKVL